MNLKLIEMLWEITNKCNKGCKYCGSKDIMSKKAPTSDKILYIANKIIKYPPEEIILTGGEPIEIGEELLNEVIDLFHENGIRVKVLSNGSILNHSIIYNNKLSNIGISINNESDIDTFLNSAQKNIHKYVGTIVTNFGKHNIWDFDIIAKFASSFNYWQVQLTMGNEFQLPESGIKSLREQINKYKIIHNNIVLADNLQDNYCCMAGINCCSVTYDGCIIPCLSQRVYDDNIKPEGNLFIDDLKTIWENNFKSIRFYCGRKCCRDYINYPPLEEEQNHYQPLEEEQNRLNKVNDIFKDKHNLIVTMYGVTGQNNVFVYGVTGTSYSSEKFNIIETNNKINLDEMNFNGDNNEEA